MKPQFTDMANSVGGCINIQLNEGKATGSLYWYDDDKTTVYMSSLKVEKEVRRQGLGTKLQELREEVGRTMGANQSILLVQREAWMYKWYKRRGYSDYRGHEVKKGFIWMRKSIM